MLTVVSDDGMKMTLTDLSNNYCLQISEPLCLFKEID